MSWRSGRRYLAAQARIRTADSDAAMASTDSPRFGITVGKRNARRAVDRNLVKRVLREAARHAVPALRAAAGARRVDVVIRLKAPLGQPGAAARAQLKRELRGEADGLLAQLAAALSRPSSASA